ncbi:inactive transglutaminase family protein [Alkalilimnicola sp. S0819]|uniref:inactive transglutaminase family protein n=1 Tax=Alkalilimnicola sp. S0819 TaxID=2613922 RepID=UPI0012628ED2|nr:inactive transglutaminase family protein [Alkalilimnicola sp. S0819]KAB7622807.1 hypothetical protein F3N43_11735 [Alkalilimnicola sp. S0819]MPQ17304.1 hypothetical protein [Alkalilimnicola sp. S0819]
MALRDPSVRVLALLLLVTGIGMAWYKSQMLGLPLLPTEQARVWTVEARVKFEAEGGPAKLDLAIPAEQLAGHRRLGEDFISSNYGLATEQRGDNRLARWAVRRARGEQVLYYRLQMTPRAEVADTQWEPPAYPAVPDYPEPYGSAVTALLETVRGESADIASFTRALLRRFGAEQPDDHVRLLRENAPGSAESVRRLIWVLAGARIPARIVWLLPMEDGMRQGSLQPWLQVHEGQRWLSYDPVSGAPGLPGNALVWRVGDGPLVTTSGGSPAQVEFSAALGERDVVELAQRDNAGLAKYSLYGLPVNTQNAYRILLAVPIGALLVVLLRNVVGVKTFGTFMPVLIALAFRETRLLWGITLFIMIVAIGLLLRRYLEHLKLLLVPRLAAVLTLVILIMVGISLLSHQLGLDRALSVALFPMVILAMTVERMSLVWEEHGARDAFQQGFGSLLVAVLGYLVMNQALVQHLVFVFPELLLVVLAATLLLGRYTGYRLSELWRFRSAAAARELS